MSVALQIRDVPEDVRDVLAEAASKNGQSLQAYLLGVVTREARIAGNADLIDSVAGFRVELPDGGEPERVIREGREAGFEVDRSELP